ncbi:amidohydrolase family protein [Opitutaceae bacterium]|nr:amidohydrolase family protein [Opitutaceae bacterium]
MTTFTPIRSLFLTLFASTALSLSAQTLLVYADTLHTMAGPSIEDAVIVISDGKIVRAGPADSTIAPRIGRVIKAAVVTPGLIDAHSVLGLSGQLNQPHDQDQLDKSAPLQADLRAIDAYDAREALVPFTRSLGITTINTGHAPRALVSGTTMVAKLHARTADQDVIAPQKMVTVTLGQSGISSTDAAKGKAPGTRPKSLAMLRADLIKAQEYTDKRATAEADKKPARNLHLEALARALSGEQRLLINAQRVVDILGALRLAREFDLDIVLDGAAEAHLIIDEIKASGFPVVLHPTMARAAGELENASMETAAKLQAAGIPFAIQGGYEAYAPKSRNVLFEAGVLVSKGLTWDQAMASITKTPAEILGLADRIGTIEPGKDADLALYNGDPFEYTTHCTGTLIDGEFYPGETDHL